MQKEIEPTTESEEELKLLKEVFYTAQLDESQVDVLIIKFEFWKIIRILSWINRFSHNTKSKEKQKRPLKTDEINKMIEMFIKREQSIFETKDPIQSDMKQLNLVKHHNEVYQCQGRIQGDDPIYIPRNIGSERPVSEADRRTTNCVI